MNTYQITFETNKDVYVHDETYVLKANRLMEVASLSAVITKIEDIECQPFGIELVDITGFRVTQIA
ncbi:MAG: hypothetical protein JSV32_06490 [Dehalococcoidia bacterium]|nr:MAG: hypothetical protein JSV32_06490 [Dehalococcoidia bacterium]